MPFTYNQQFKQVLRVMITAKNIHYMSSDGRKIFDSTSSLSCVDVGHCRPKITEAIQKQAVELGYAPAFQIDHPIVFELANRLFELANRLIDIAPAGMGHVFFTNSGSESVGTALKMVLAYHRVKGDGARLIGREHSYRNVNFGGISVGGIGTNRQMFGML